MGISLKTFMKAKREKYEKVRSENLKREDLDVDGRVIFRCIFEKYGIKICTGFKWLKIKSDYVFF
jgi:predicted metal-binding protein